MAADLLQRLRKLRPADYALFLEAYAALTFARLVILIVPFRRATRLYGLQATAIAPPAQVPITPAARAVAWAIDAAARRTPWESACLVQALAGAAMLRRRGVPGVVFLGVRRVPTADDGVMEAHAWVRVGATILIGAAGHRRFAPIAAFAIQPSHG